MNTNIVGQYQNLVKEQEKLRKTLKDNERKLLFLKQYLKHVEDIKISRNQIKNKKLISQEELFNELGI
ncbi:MAG: hypothetical protein HYX22_02300 [Candidatus Yanofskybacteria bacterium]|nr:hypothetical protein [Candidatus Yanofskybacteria bacterium]